MKVSFATRGEDRAGSDIGNFGMTVNMEQVPRAGDCVWLRVKHPNDAEYAPLVRFFVRRVDWFPQEGHPVAAAVIVEREP